MVHRQYKIAGGRAAQIEDLDLLPVEFNWVQLLWERVIDRRVEKVSHIFYVEKYSNVNLFFPATLCQNEN